MTNYDLIKRRLFRASLVHFEAILIFLKERYSSLFTLTRPLASYSKSEKIDEQIPETVLANRQAKKRFHPLHNILLLNFP